MDNTNNPLIGLMLLIIYAAIWPFRMIGRVFRK